MVFGSGTRELPRQHERFLLEMLRVLHFLPVMDVVFELIAVASSFLLATADGYGPNRLLTLRLVCRTWYTTTASSLIA